MRNHECFDWFFSLPIAIIYQSSTRHFGNILLSSVFSVFLFL